MNPDDDDDRQDHGRTKPADPMTVEAFTQLWTRAQLANELAILDGILAREPFPSKARDALLDLRSRLSREIARAEEEERA